MGVDSVYSQAKISIYIKRLLALGVGLACVIFGLLTLAPLKTDIQMNRFDTEFCKIKHPYDTQEVRHFAGVNNLAAAGSWCTFVIADVRTYTTSKRDIVKYYSSMTIPNPITGQKEPLYVAFVDGEKDDTNPELEQNLDDILRLSEGSGWEIIKYTHPHTYILFCADTESPGFDTRFW